MKALFNYKYLGSEHMKGLDQYKYSAIDTSPLSIYVMHPFWNWFVELFPKWIAPNLMTFAGFLLLVFNFVLFSFYDFHFSSTSIIPAWVWLVAAVCQFFSHQLDGIDGKQARRTKSSSALGELFDHGVDSWACLLFPVCIFSAFTKGDQGWSPISMHFMLCSIYVTFVNSHWEKYNTKILFLPWAYDISMLLMTLGYLLAYFFTTDFFYVYLPFISIRLARFVEIMWPICGFLSSTPVSINHVVMSYRTGTGYKRSLYECLRPLISPMILFLSSTWWAIQSPSSIIDKQPRIFFTMVGTTFSNIACRLVVAQMTSTRSDGINKLLYMLVPIQLASVYGLVSGDIELILLVTYSLVSVFAHLHYGICVVRQISRHLKIYTFNITERPKNQG